MVVTGKVEGVGGNPRTARGIVQLRNTYSAGTRRSPCYEYFPVRQQGGRMAIARILQRIGRCPGSAQRIIYFRACEDSTAGNVAGRDEYLAVGQERRRVILTRGTHWVQERPCSD